MSYNWPETEILLNQKQPIDAFLSAISEISLMEHGLPIAISDVTNLATELLKRPTVYLGTTQKSGSKFIGKSATTTSGVATFYLTDNGLVGGDALFTNVYDETVDFEVNDSANSYRYAWTLSGDKKTMTVTVTRQAPTTILGIGVLGALNPTPNGTGVRLTLWGD